MNLMSASKYMTYNNSLFNVSSFLQTSSASHHSPSSTSSCSSNSSNSFSPNSSINAQCLPAALNQSLNQSLSHSALLTSTGSQSGSRYLSNSGHLPFPSGFSASPSSFLRASSPSPSDLQSLSRLTLAQAQLAAAVAGNGSANHHETSSTSQTNTAPQVTSLALKQAALAAALQARQQAASSSGSLLTSADQPSSLLTPAGQPFSTGNYSPPTKSSFSPPKNFYYNSLKSSPAFQQTTNGSSPNLEIMNLSPQAYTGPNGPFTAEHPARAPLLDAGLPRNLPASPDAKLLGTLRSSPIHLTNLDALPDHCAKSAKRAANRQGKAVRTKTNHKDEFGFSKVLKRINLLSLFARALFSFLCVSLKTGIGADKCAAYDLTIYSLFFLRSSS